MVSTYQIGIQQADGRIWIKERHEDALGRAYLQERLSDVAADHQAVADAYGATLEASLKDGEVSAFDRKLLTAVEFLAAIRERLRNASGEDAARIATWLMDKSDAGEVTAAQLRAAFNMTNQQLTALQTRLSALRTAYNAVRTATGE